MPRLASALSAVVLLSAVSCGGSSSNPGTPTPGHLWLALAPNGLLTFVDRGPPAPF